MDTHIHHRSQALVFLFLAFVAPFAVLLVPPPGESYVRAAYAVCLGVILAGGGAWVAFRAHPEELAKWWTPNPIKPAWAIFMRVGGALLIMGAAFLMKSTVTDVVELLSGHPRTFTAVARSVEGKAFLHPVFQAVRFREGKGFATPYMFAYGGKHLVAGQQYVVTVLPRSRWLLSAHEATETASQ